MLKIIDNFGVNNIKYFLMHKEIDIFFLKWLEKIYLNWKNSSFSKKLKCLSNIHGLLFLKTPTEMFYLNYSQGK